MPSRSRFARGHGSPRVTGSTGIKDSGGVTGSGGITGSGDVTGSRGVKAAVSGGSAGDRPALKKVEPSVRERPFDVEALSVLGFAAKGQLV